MEDTGSSNGSFVPRLTPTQSTNATAKSGDIWSSVFPFSESSDYTTYDANSNGNAYSEIKSSLPTLTSAISVSGNPPTSSSSSALFEHSLGSPFHHRTQNSKLPAPRSPSHFSSSFGRIYGSHLPNMNANAMSNVNGGYRDARYGPPDLSNERIASAQNSVRPGPVFGGSGSGFGAAMGTGQITWNHGQGEYGGHSEDPRPRNIYVLNLPHDLSQSGFESLFSKFGTVEHACLLSMLDHHNRRRGFILMLKHEDAAKVMNVHGKMLEGFRLDLSWAQVQKSSQLDIQRTKANHVQRFKPPPSDAGMRYASPSSSSFLRKSSSAESYDGMQGPRQEHRHASGSMRLIGTHESSRMLSAPFESERPSQRQEHAKFRVDKTTGMRGETPLQNRMTLFVEGLDASVFPSLEHIVSFFSEYGYVSTARFGPVLKPEERTIYLEFTLAEHAAYAVAMVHGKILGKSAILINKVPGQEVLPKATPPQSRGNPEHVGAGRLLTAHNSDSFMVSHKQPQHQQQQQVAMMKGHTPTLNEQPSPVRRRNCMMPRGVASAALTPSTSFSMSTTGSSASVKSFQSSLGRLVGRSTEPWISSSSNTLSTWSSVHPTPSSTTAAFDPFGGSWVNLSKQRGSKVGKVNTSNGNGNGNGSNSVSRSPSLGIPDVGSLRINVGGSGGGEYSGGPSSSSSIITPEIEPFNIASLVQGHMIPPSSDLTALTSIDPVENDNKSQRSTGERPSTLWGKDQRSIMISEFDYDGCSYVPTLSISSAVDHNIVTGSGSGDGSGSGSGPTVVEAKKSTPDGSVNLHQTTNTESILEFTLKPPVQSGIATSIELEAGNLALTQSDHAVSQTDGESKS